MAGGKLGRDSGQVPIQGFAPNRILTTTAWTVGSAKAYSVPSDTTYTINGAGASGTLKAGAIRVIPKEVTLITFASELIIEVMG